MNNSGRPLHTGGKAKELTKDEIKRIDKCLSGTRYGARNRALLWLGLGSGMRIAEMVGLKISDVYRNGKVLNQIVLEKHSVKNKKSRTVFLTQQAQKELDEYIETLRKIQPNMPLFPSPKKRNDAITPNSAQVALAKLFQESGVSHASSHSLRRTHANTLRRNGVDLKIIQEQLGHSSLATTEAYFAVDPMEMEQVISKMKF